MLADDESPPPSSSRGGSREPNASPGPRPSHDATARLKVSIQAIILAVAACAMAFTALRTASRLWYGALYTFTAFLLMTAVIASRFRRGSERAFWFGFAVFGWGFFLLGYRPWMSAFGDLDDPNGQMLNPNLLTSRVILFLLPRLRKATNNLDELRSITLTTLGIAHLLMNLVVGIAGGLVAILVRRTSRHRASIRPFAVLVSLILPAAVALPVVFGPPAVRYFPSGILEERRDLADFIEAWYSKHLAAMGEPSLPDLAQRDREATIYRLLWLPSFHHPVCVRIERDGDRARLQARVLDGMGGYEPGTVAIDRHLSLGARQWERFNRLLDEAAFWELPTRLEDDSGSDGDQLVVEGVRGGRYHVVDRSDPDPVYKALCGYMLELTKIELGRQWHHDDAASAPEEPE